MTSIRDLAYTSANAEIRAGEDAMRLGNIGKARVCARRGCFFAINFWLENFPDKGWGESAMSMLNQLQRDYSIPKIIRDAAERLTKKVDSNFETGIKEDPLKDGAMIIEYFLNPNNLQ